MCGRNIENRYATLAVTSVEVFERIDKDGSGRLTLEDLIEGEIHGWWKMFFKLRVGKIITYFTNESSLVRNVLYFFTDRAHPNLSLRMACWLCVVDVEFGVVSFRCAFRVVKSVIFKHIYLIWSIYLYVFSKPVEYRCPHGCCLSKSPESYGHWWATWIQYFFWRLLMLMFIFIF